MIRQKHHLEDVNNYVDTARTVGLPVKEHGENKEFQSSVEAKQVMLWDYLSSVHKDGYANFASSRGMEAKGDKLKKARPSIIAIGAILSGAARSGSPLKKIAQNYRVHMNNYLENIEKHGSQVVVVEPAEVIVEKPKKNV